MTRLSWNDVGTRTYETGVDRGVLYLGGLGVPWNGLVSVSETPTGGEVKAYYLDGIKYMQRLSGEEFEASIEAYTYPDEFGQCDGTRSVKNGLFVTQQKRSPFSLAYRSRIGNDVEGTDHAYKIHLVYDSLAQPSAQTHSTIGNAADPFNFVWKITTRPPRLSGRRPTAHFVIDSRDTPNELLGLIEDILYGSIDTSPRIPPVDELVYLFDTYANGILDARTVGTPYYNTFDGGNPPTEIQTATINGGVP